MADFPVHDLQDLLAEEIKVADKERQHAAAHHHRDAYSRWDERARTLRDLSEVVAAFAGTGERRGS